MPVQSLTLSWLLCRFRLINYRHDMQFAFMRKGMMDPVLAAWSPVITVANPNEPLQGHLALTKDNRWGLWGCSVAEDACDTLKQACQIGMLKSSKNNMELSAVSGT